MNLIKSSIFVLFLSIITYSHVYAVTPTLPVTTTTSSSSTVPVASIDLKDAKIVAQNNNNIAVSFSISNRGSLQTGIKYGLQLVSDSKDKYVADEKVYDESLTLETGASVKKDFVYTVPAQLGGNFTLILVSQSEGGVPFGQVTFGKVKITASIKSINILPESCFLKIKGDKTNKNYTLTQSVDISSSESLNLNCTAVNETSGPISATPIYETRYQNSFGSITEQSGGSYTPVSFTKGEKKNITLELPKGDLAKFYTIKVQLMSGDKISNPVYARYVLQGVIGNIYRISLDKDYYRAGDKIDMSVLWSASTGSTIRNSVSGVRPRLYLETSITSENGRECMSNIKSELVRDPKDNETKIPITFRYTCVNPHVSATLTDDKGNILDKKEFTFKTGKGDEMAAKNSKQGWIAVGVIVLVLIFGLLMRRRKSNI
ncbi:MAG: hypothetical protein AAB477_01690 [Patescibacteria group bacterium]